MAPNSCVWAPPELAIWGAADTTAPSSLAPCCCACTLGLSAVLLIVVALHCNPLLWLRTPLPPSRTHTFSKYEKTTPRYSCAMYYGSHKGPKSSNSKAETPQTKANKITPPCRHLSHVLPPTPGRALQYTFAMAKPPLTLRTNKCVPKRNEQSILFLHVPACLVSHHSCHACQFSGGRASFTLFFFRTPSILAQDWRLNRRLTLSSQGVLIEDGLDNL